MLNVLLLGFACQHAEQMKAVIKCITELERGVLIKKQNIILCDALLFL